MPYLYETHCHCSQCSQCAVSTSGEIVRAYHRAGYAGLVLTDHFIFGNTAVDRSLPWAERMQKYYDAFLEAKAAAEGLDFDVIFGIEHHYGDGKEVLIYGVGLDFLLENPDIPQLTLDEFVQRIHAVGGVVVQAHPYRDRYYINMNVEPRADLVDGIEIYNACSRPGEDLKALKLSRRKDFILTSGGDIHYHQDERIGAAGIWLPYRVRDEKEFAAALKRRKYTFQVGHRNMAEVQDVDLADVQN